jgi:CHAT domain-containing protein
LLRQHQALNLAELGDAKLAAFLEEMVGYADTDLRHETVLRSPYQVGALIADLNRDVDLILSLIDTLEAADMGKAADKTQARLAQKTFSLVETMRSVPWQAARQMHVPSTDLEMAETGRKLRRISSDMAGVIARPDHGQDTASRFRELQKLVGERDTAARKLRGKQPFDVVETGKLVEYLRKQADRTVAVGFRRCVWSTIDPIVPQREAQETRMLASVLQPEGTVKTSRLGALKDITKAVERWRAAIGRPVRGGVAAPSPADEERAAGEDLRRLVLDPVRAAAGKKAVLHVCLDDVLHLVPLDALPLEDGVVGDQFEIRNEVSFSRLLERSKAAAAAGGLLVFSDIDFGKAPAEAAGDEAGASARRGRGLAWKPLAAGGAAIAAEAYERVHERKSVCCKGASATKTSFKQKAKDAAFLHLVTHGYLAPDELQPPANATPEQAVAARWLKETVQGLAPMTLCGLVFAGANRGSVSETVLMAEELTGMSLANCQLAVLSACEPNGGSRPGVGVQSLQSALHCAGVRTTITSLWDVEDKWVQPFMAEFYHQLWELKVGKAGALMQAKKKLRKDGAPTAAWAAWVLTGDPK